MALTPQQSTPKQGGVTPAQLLEVLPNKFKKRATQKLADTINNLTVDPVFAKEYQTNVLTYMRVLEHGQYKLSDYLKAVEYVSYKLMDMTNADAYKYTFPERAMAFAAQGLDDKQISAYVAAYNKNKLVTAITEQAIIPAWLVNHHTYQEAINVLADKMMTASSDKVRVEAATAILTHLKKPETKHQLDIGVTLKTDSLVQGLQDALAQAAAQQRELIENGVSTRTIANHRLGEMIDVTPQEIAEK